MGWGAAMALEVFNDPCAEHLLTGARSDVALKWLFVLRIRLNLPEN
jgi:hypothetical protein